METLRRQLRVIDLALAATAAGALWAVGLAEVSWLPFACIAATGEGVRGRC